MARNKYPEETINLILDTATRLFMQKGYDETSIQDIMNETKLSKGAIYYHFASKEEIFCKICEQIGEATANSLNKVIEDKSMNGQEKLRMIFRGSLLAENKDRMIQMIPFLLDSPKFLVMEIKNIFDEVVPCFVEPIIREGMMDGSIHTEHPKELAEALMMLADIWLNPLLMPSKREEIRARCFVFSQITEGLGLKLMDEELMEVVVNFCRS